MEAYECYFPRQVNRFGLQAASRRWAAPGRATVGRFA